MELDVHHVHPIPVHVYGTVMMISTLMIHLARLVQPVRFLMRTDGLDALAETIAISVTVSVPHVPPLMDSARLALQMPAVAHHVHVTQLSLTLLARILVMDVTSTVRLALILPYILVQHVETEL